MKFASKLIHGVGGMHLSEASVIAIYMYMYNAYTKFFC